MPCQRDDLLKHLTELFADLRCKDYCHNGLQVEGSEKVTCIATACTASQLVIDQALAQGADCILVHHGLIWGGAKRIDGMLRKRLAPMLAAECNLFAYHLPLDAHPSLGNNAVIISELAAKDDGAFADHAGLDIGRLGVFDQGISIDELISRCRSLFDHEVLHCPGNDQVIKRIGAVSGGGQSHLRDAAEAGCDAFICGEASEPNWHEAAELGCHMLACGHHATESIAVHRLGAVLADHFGLSHCQIQQTNPI